ncbi:unnamed protein product [Aphanomyces euteiches]
MVESKKRKATAAVSVDDEIAQVNEILQGETTARESWQIGKRLKTLIDAHPDMTNEQLGNTMCMWGTAIARIASENEDATLAEAAMDKFQQALNLLGETEMGPYGLALYGSVSMIVATEKQDRTVLEAALGQFEKAVKMDTPEAFESHFQYAKALREGSLLVEHLLEAQEGSKDAKDTFQSPESMQQKGLDICKHILQHHEAVLADESANEKQKDEATSSASGDDEEEEVEDEVTREDLSEVILLQAQLLALLHRNTDSEEQRLDIYNTFKQAYDIHKDNVNALAEMNAYLCRLPKLSSWLPQFEWMQKEFEAILNTLDFDLASCYEHVLRESTLPQPKPVDEHVPKVLDVLGRNLLGQLKAHDTKPQPAILEHTIKVLRCAHHLHDVFGCYSLAVLYALPLYRNTTECHVWLETCESYGVLDEEFQVADFSSMESESWYSLFVTNGTLKAQDKVELE